MSLYLNNEVLRQSLKLQVKGSLAAKSDYSHLHYKYQKQTNFPLVFKGKIYVCMIIDPVLLHFILLNYKIQEVNY